jgi:nucleoside-diphosphate-sugar epimerase
MRRPFTVLITGNMGYIGPVVVRRLRSRYPDMKLIGYDIGYFAHCLTDHRVFPECLTDLQYFDDVRNITEHHFEGVDGVVHLAAISNDPMGNYFEDVTYQINYHASVKIAELAQKKGVSHFVFASSCSMYGAAEDEARTEKSPLNPLTAYAKSKVNTEKAIEKLASDDFTVTSLRFATACGWSERLRLDLVLNDFVAGALASGQITILSDGTPWRPLIDVRDMARAIDWALARDPGCGGPFLAVNCGKNTFNYQVKTLAEAVADMIPGVSVSINTNAAPDKRSYRVNFDLFEQLAPEHQPRYDLSSSIKELVDGLSAIGFTDTDFRNSDRIRLKVLRSLQAEKLLSKQLQWNSRR